MKVPSGVTPKKGPPVWSVIGSGGTVLSLGELKFFPFTMAEVGSLTTAGFTVDVEVHGDLLILPEGIDGFRTIDVSDPAVPVPLGGFDTPGGAFAARMYGNHVVIADGHSGLEIFDVSDPATPTLIGGLDTPGR